MQVVNRSQRVVTSGFNPKSEYSRVVGFCFNVHAGVGNEGMGWTKPLGNDLWLLRAQIWIRSPDPAVSIGVGWKLVTSTEAPISTAAARDEMEPVVDIYTLNVRYAMFSVTDSYFDFSMKKRYKGVGRRFVMWANNASDVNDLHIQTAFEISEG